MSSPREQKFGAVKPEKNKSEKSEKLKKEKTAKLKQLQDNFKKIEKKQSAQLKLDYRLMNLLIEQTYPKKFKDESAYHKHYHHHVLDLIAEVKGENVEAIKKILKSFSKQNVTKASEEVLRELMLSFINQGPSIQSRAFRYFVVATWFHLGLGVFPRNDRIAEEFYLEAANLGDPLGYQGLAKIQEKRLNTKNYKDSNSQNREALSQFAFNLSMAHHLFTQKSKDKDPASAFYLNFSNGGARFLYQLVELIKLNKLTNARPPSLSAEYMLFLYSIARVSRNYYQRIPQPSEISKSSDLDLGDLKAEVGRSKSEEEFTPVHELCDRFVTDARKIIKNNSLKFLRTVIANHTQAAWDEFADFCIRKGIAKAWELDIAVRSNLSSSQPEYIKSWSTRTQGQYSQRSVFSGFFGKSDAKIALSPVRSPDSVEVKTAASEAQLLTRSISDLSVQKTPSGPAALPQLQRSASEIAVAAHREEVKNKDASPPPGKNEKIKRKKYPTQFRLAPIAEEATQESQEADTGKGYRAVK